MRHTLLTALLIATPWSVHAETIYVQSVKAKLMSAPALTAQVVAEAPKGTAFEVIGSRDGWYEVRRDGATAWLSKLVAAPHQPLTKITVLPAADSAPVDNHARRRASVVTTAGAARGLAPAARARRDDTGSDYAALEKMEATHVTEEETRRFIEEGAAP